MEEVVNVRKEQSGASAPAPAPHDRGGHRSSREKLSMGKKVIFKLVGLVVIVAVVFLVWWGISAINNNSAIRGVQKGNFQAVFLTNGQAYFGKITAINPNFVTLTDIYYLQATQSATGVQPASSSTASNSSSSNASTQLSLVKLGNEIHGPEDQMYIARDQVLFWENLKSNGKVVQAILKSETQ